MAASTTRRSSVPVLGSHSPGRFSTTSSRHTSSSPFASTTASAFSTRPSTFNRSASPTRINLYSTTSSSSSQSVRFSLDRRSSSPTASVSTAARSPSSHGHQVVAPRPTAVKRTCMCSPTNHPGSFRCSLHKAAASANRGSTVAAPYQSNRLNARRSAMTNSLVRIGTVEGELVKRALAALIRPSSHQQRRRTSFQPRPSRLSVISRTVDSDQ